MSPTRFDSFDWGQAFLKATLSGKTALLISSWFCVGRIRWAPGTVGTLGAIPLVVQIVQ